MTYRVLHYLWHVYETGPSGGRGHYLNEYGTAKTLEQAKQTAQTFVGPGRNVEVGVLMAVDTLTATEQVHYEALETFWGERPARSPSLQMVVHTDLGDFYPCEAQGAWYQVGHHGEVGTLYAPMWRDGSMDPEEIGEVSDTYEEATGAPAPPCEHVPSATFGCA